MLRLLTLSAVSSLETFIWNLSLIQSQHWITLNTASTHIYFPSTGVYKFPPKKVVTGQFIQGNRNRRLDGFAQKLELWLLSTHSLWPKFRCKLSRQVDPPRTWSRSGFIWCLPTRNARWKGELSNQHQLIRTGDWFLWLSLTCHILLSLWIQMYRDKSSAASPSWIVLQSRLTCIFTY